MKKRTVNLLNSLKTVVETSYPNLPKKAQKQILEDFMYDSMVNQLGQWTETDSGVGGEAFAGGASTTMALALMALTGWTFKKALEFLGKYGKKGFEAIKQKFMKDKSVMDKFKDGAKDRISDLKKAVALAESCMPKKAVKKTTKKVSK